MRRVVSVWLPDWPVTVWTRANARGEPPQDASGPPEKAEEAPFALVDRGARGLTLHALNPAARSLGLSRGQSHADARAIAPQLVSAPAEPERDLEALKRLALWAERFSPAVAADTALPAQEGLFLDMTGGTHLFGGEAALLAELRARLAKAGVPARLAIADTPGAAWALARLSRSPETIAPAGRSARVVGRLGREAQAAGALQPPPASPPVPATLAGDLAQLGAEVMPGVADEVVAAALTVWAAVFGIISFELFGQFNNVITDRDAYFGRALADLARLFGLPA